MPVSTSSCPNLNNVVRQQNPEIRIEVSDAMANNPHVDRIFNSAITILALLLLSSGIWIFSKVMPQYGYLFLEEVSLVVFTITLTAFVIFGIVAMFVMCSATDTQIKDDLSAERSAISERSCTTERSVTDTYPENSVTTV